MIITTATTETTNTNSVEGVVDLLKAGGWASEAAAVISSGPRAQITVDLEMTEAQASVIREIGQKRGQGLLPCWIPQIGAAIWAHAGVVQEWEQILPSCYWERATNGNYSYVSCTGNTEASVLPDGTLRGKTRTTAARLAASPAVWGEAPPYLWEMRLESLVGKYWDALAAFRVLPDGRGCQEGKDLLASADKAISEARKIASLAMGRRAPAWQELPPDWRG